MRRYEVQVEEYIDSNGKSPYAKWFASLNVNIAAKVAVTLLRLEQGNTSNIKWFKGMGELKLNFGPGYRIYLAKSENEILILLGGGSKNTQQSDIKKAQAIWEEYKQRKKLEKQTWH